jgi:hypothetical protein
MKIEFRNLLTLVVCAVIIPLQLAAPFLSQSARENVNSATGALILGLFAVLVIYNKFKFGVFLPGRLRPNETSVKRSWGRPTYIAVFSIVTFVPVFLLLMALMSGVPLSNRVKWAIEFIISVPIAFWLGRKILEYVALRLSKSSPTSEN